MINFTKKIESYEKKFAKYLDSNPDSTEFSKEDQEYEKVNKVVNGKSLETSSEAEQCYITDPITPP